MRGFHLISGLVLAVVAWQPVHCIAVSPLDRHAGVQDFVDSQTVLFGWISLADLDLRELANFLNEAGIQQIDAREMSRVQAVRETLISLDVERIYVIADMVSLTSGPVQIVIPTDKQQSVKLLMSTMIDGSSYELEEAPGAVLGGTAIGLKLLKDRQGEPSDRLQNAIAACQGDHGLAFATPAYLLMQAMDVLKSAISEDDAGELAETAEALAQVQWLALSGSLPPNSMRFQIHTQSKSAAEQLKLFVAKTTADRAETALPLETDQDSVVLATDNISESLQMMTILRKAIYGGGSPQQQNAMKQIALALHNYASANRHFPPQSLVSDDGKRLLSWRVLILPYLEQGVSLYQQFRLDEPWDSPHNLQVAQTIPAVYRSMDVELRPAENGAARTRILAPLTKDSVFGRPGEPISFRDITDGTSNTIWFVQTYPEQAVIWTKPDDLIVDPENSLQSILGNMEGFHASYVDGSVHYFTDELKSQILDALLSISGGEVINRDDLE